DRRHVTGVDQCGRGAQSQRDTLNHKARNIDERSRGSTRTAAGTDDPVGNPPAGVAAGTENDGTSNTTVGDAHVFASAAQGNGIARGGTRARGNGKAVQIKGHVINRDGDGVTTANAQTFGQIITATGADGER